ncbi:hypothetical protein GXW82_42540 [Streptacidiphilus sp. 4-A2]|nr:hypothetical protein [Streptacidiphilus sp. 4-A2]
MPAGSALADIAEHERARTRRTWASRSIARTRWCCTACARCSRGRRRRRRRRLQPARGRHGLLLHRAADSKAGYRRVELYARATTVTSSRTIWAGAARHRPRRRCCGC